MRNKINVLLVVVLALVLSGCRTKDVLYFNNADQVDLSASKGLYDATIKPKDVLAIGVTTLDPLAAQPFNTNISIGRTFFTTSSTATANRGCYLVDNDGNIDFPVVGKIRAVGLTKTQLEESIRTKIKPYMAESENPLVIVQMVSFKISILGEVRSPGTFYVDQEKISIVEALATAGDLTLYGKRDNICIIREDATGQKSMHYLNLNDANIINSPYYYLQQNDCIYVSPNKVQARNSHFGQSTNQWYSVGGLLLSVVSVVIAITR